MTIYEATIPFWANSLKCLGNLLMKASDQAGVQDYDSAVLAELRLAPDMFPLRRQVQVACDMAVRACARLANQPLPEFADNEQTLEQLIERINGAVDYLNLADPGQFEGAASRQIDVPVGGGNTMPMSGQEYAFSFAIPNLYFHMTTTYALLRSNGVPLGKRDFLMAG